MKNAEYITTALEAGAMPNLKAMLEVCMCVIIVLTKGNKCYCIAPLESALSLRTNVT